MKPENTTNRGQTSANWIFALVALIVALTLLWVARPLVHGFVMAVYTTPIWWVVAVISIVLFVALNTGTNWNYEKITTVVGVVFVAGFLLGPMVTGTLAQDRLGQNVMDSRTEVDTLENTDAERPRVLTMAVCRQYAENTFNEPKYKVAGDGDIAMLENGTPHCTYSKAPDNFNAWLNDPQQGMISVDMTQQNADVSEHNQEMKYGEGTAWWRSLRWNLLKQGEYFMNYHDEVHFTHEGEEYEMVRLTKPEFHWDIMATTPTPAGVALVDSEGNMEYLSLEEARKDPRLEGQNLVAYEYTRTAAAATKYRNGILNTLPGGNHEGEVRIASVPGQGNEQPFMSLTEGGGVVQTVAMEPVGGGTGLREIWVMNGRTGEFSQYSPNSTLYGPGKAASLVRQASRTTDWDRFEPSEPLPTVVDNTFYWRVAVVPESANGISYIAFVNGDAGTGNAGEVTEAETTPAVKQFLRGETVEEAVEGGNNTGGGQSPEMIVQRVDGDGNVVETMEVYGDDSVRIVQGDSVNSTAIGSDTSE